MSVSIDQWNNAQKKEISFWDGWIKKNPNSKDEKWVNQVINYFELKNKNLNEEILIDIGSGPIGILTALNAKEKIAIDPLKINTKDSSIRRINAMGENIPLENEIADKVFIYNLLQHVHCPEDVLKEAYRICKINKYIYILEQLNLPTDSMHPHSLKEEMFENWISKNNFEIVKKNIQKDCYFDHPNEEGSGYCILCLIVKKL